MVAAWFVSPARGGVGSLRRQVSRLERALGRKTMDVEIAGELLRGWE
jgi:transposase